MRLVDLVIDCLKETHRNDDTSISAENFCNGELATNFEYSQDINNILLSINKGINRFVTAEKLPYKKVAVNGTGSTNIYDLSQYDIKNIKSVFTIENGKTIWLGWTNISRKTIIIDKDVNTLIYIVYSPSIKAFKLSDICTGYGTDSAVINETDLDDEYGISDEMCSYIGYFAKSELWENSDPDRCKRYLNYFESFLAELRTEQTYPHQGKVYPHYKIR